MKSKLYERMKERKEEQVENIHKGLKYPSFMEKLRENKQSVVILQHELEISGLHKRLAETQRALEVALKSTITPEQELDTAYREGFATGRQAAEQEFYTKGYDKAFMDIRSNLESTWESIKWKRGGGPLGMAGAMREE